MRLIAADAERVSFEFEVDRGVVVSHVGHVLNAVDALRHDVGVLHGDQRHFDTDHRADVTRPDACDTAATVGTRPNATRPKQKERRIMRRG